MPTPKINFQISFHEMKGFFPIHSVHPPFCRKVEPPTKFSKKEGGGGLTGPRLLEGFAGKEGVMFSGGLQFSHKKQIKIRNI